MKIFDAHADTASRLLDENKSLFENDLHIDLTRLSKNESIQVFASFIDPLYKTCAKERFDAIVDNFYSEAEKHKITICRNYDEICKKDGGVKAILSLEGGEPIESLEDLDYIKSRGVMIIAPTWNFKNQLGCGVLEKEDTGLTEFGKKAVRRMNELGILIDVSHLSEKSFWDVAEISKKPICASHSNSKPVMDNPRNLTDEQFCKIRDMKGCVGINFYPPFLGEDIKCVIDHIDRFLSLGGEDNIGIGSDFDGVDRLPKGIGGCQDIEKVIKMLPYPEKIRKKIAYENFLRVLHAQNC